jgi:predicted PhzF superfamily epimerase YddE/YHI9
MRVLVTRAFADSNDEHGNAARVVIGSELPGAEDRQAIASAAPEPVTTFVAPDMRTVRIHNHQRERQFTGHALLGTAAALRVLGAPATWIEVPAGRVGLWNDEQGVQWLHAPAAWSPAANARHRQVARPADVEALPGPPPDEPVQVWAWIDETAGYVRARQFKPSEGIAEDEACGSASMVLARKLGRELLIVHGRGSRIAVRPRGDGIDLGGRCVIDEELDGLAV